MAQEIMERLDHAVELDDRGIHVMMSPVNRHELAVGRLQEQLVRQVRDGLHVHTGDPQIDDPVTGRMRRPDLVVVPWAALDRPGYLRPSDIELVAEVVSVPNPENDYESKTADYPAMGIPVYVIIDPRTSVVTVLTEPHSTPQGQRYRNRTEYNFGETAKAGAYEIETSAFSPYRKD
ncbi:Uma2 family endonuclease [Actinomadura sp. 6N118]|uniref:Uma2 family endonuclease n=1 Tax=Actinomadura sp. 6N118 TaxID=3375151 RepID=UPI00379095B1